MEFTASDGTVIPEQELKMQLNFTIKNLKQYNYSIIFVWEKELLEWFLDRKMEHEKDENGNYIKLNQHITEDELEQLKQLIDYLRI